MPVSYSGISAVRVLRSAVFGGVQLGRFSRVMCGLMTVPGRNVGVVTGLLVISAFMMRGGFPMMPGCVLVMLSRLRVMLCACMWHFSYLSMNSVAVQSKYRRASEYSIPDLLLVSAG